METNYGYYICLYPYDFVFTGRIKYEKTSEDCKVYFEIEYYEDEIRLGWKGFYNRKKGPFITWIRDIYFIEESEITITTCN